MRRAWLSRRRGRPDALLLVIERELLSLPASSAGPSGPELELFPAEILESAGAVLDKHTKNVSSSESREAKAVARQRLTRGSKIRLREVAWDISINPRLVGCGRRRIEGGSPVTVRVKGGVAHYTNVQLCGSVHTCPVCASKIRQGRAEEIEHALDTLRRVPLVWGHRLPKPQGIQCDVSERHTAQLGSAEFLTLTLPHDFGDKTAQLLETVALAFRRVIGGSGYERDRKTYGIVGTIRALDITYGPSGAHPHLHALIIFARALSDAERVALLASFYDRWASTIESQGYRRPLPGLCQMEPVRSAEDVSRYVSKMALVEDAEKKVHRVGLEMARHDLKQGRESDSRGRGREHHRTPFQILADFSQTGDMDDSELFNEFESAIKGHQAITWSRGLKAILGVHEMTDEELAAEEVGGSDIILLEAPEWQLVTGTRGGQARVLELAETEGSLGVFAYISELASKPPPLSRARAGPRRFCTYSDPAELVSGE